MYTKNHNPTATLKGLTPYQARFKRVPDISFLHRFGCRAFVYNDCPDHKKLDPRARPGIFVGYADCQKAYRVYFPDTGKIITSIHVKFNDDVNGYSGPLPEGKSYDALFESYDPTLDDLDTPSTSRQTASSTDDHPAPPDPAPADPVPLHEHEPLAAPAPRPRGRPKGSKTKKGGLPTRHSSRVRARHPDAAPTAEVPPPAAPAEVPPVASGPGEEQPAADGFDSELTDLSSSDESSHLLEHSLIAYEVIRGGDGLSRCG